MIPEEHLPFAVVFVGQFVVAIFIIAVDVLRSPARPSQERGSGPARQGDVPINRFARDRWTTSKILGPMR